MLFYSRSKKHKHKKTKEIQVEEQPKEEWLFE